jgi:hypothetical protein
VHSSDEWPCSNGYFCVPCTGILVGLRHDQDTEIVAVPGSYRDALTHFPPASSAINSFAITGTLTITHYSPSVLLATEAVMVAHTSVYFILGIFFLLDYLLFTSSSLPRGTGSFVSMPLPYSTLPPHVLNAGLGKVPSIALRSACEYKALICMAFGPSSALLWASRKPQVMMVLNILP